MPSDKLNAAPDLSTVRSLITSVSALAQYLEISNNGIYRWIKVNRIPGTHIVKVANFYNVEVVDLLPLTGSEKANKNTVLTKPKDTLRLMVEVYRGNMTIDEVCTQLSISPLSARLILTHWGDELPTLYTTLSQLDEKRISLETAMQRLHVTKYTLHGIRRKYGYAPGPVKRTRPVSQAPARRALQRETALRVIAGKLSAVEAAVECGMSYRTVFRQIEKVAPVKLNDISAWPPVFREALVEEIVNKLPNFSEKWVKFAEDSRLFLRKSQKYPKTPDNWRNLPLKRLLVGVLIGEASLEEVAASRGADPHMLAGLFTGDMQPLGVTFEGLLELPMAHQTAVAELMLAILDRKRKVVV